MKILYYPIFETGTYHEAALANKSGLRTALQRYGEVLEIDYLDIPIPELYERTRHLLDTYQPDLFITQLHGADRISAEQAAIIRKEYPLVIWINFTGDVWTPQPEMVELARHFHLITSNNASNVELYRAAGIESVFWCLGYEPERRDYPDVPAYDVVYLGNNYGTQRPKLYEILRSLPYEVGIYGNGWPESQGVNYYDTTHGDALYKRAKMTISNHEWPEAKGYIGNRPVQAMYAGCFVLHQYTSELEKWTGLKEGKHLVVFHELDELPALVEYWMQETDKREKIAAVGQMYTSKRLSWDARVDQLFREQLPGIIYAAAH